MLGIYVHDVVLRSARNVTVLAHAEADKVLFVRVPRVRSNAHPSRIAAFNIPELERVVSRGGDDFVSNPANVRNGLAVTLKRKHGRVWLSQIVAHEPVIG